MREIFKYALIFAGGAIGTYAILTSVGFGGRQNETASSQNYSYDTTRTTVKGIVTQKPAPDNSIVITKPSSLESLTIHFTEVDCNPATLASEVVRAIAEERYIAAKFKLAKASPDGKNWGEGCPYIIGHLKSHERERVKSSQLN